ncbi:uncharacterized protein BCR38DRAFT_472400 [Pseudomassariella vexata]|uniref:Zn(2)-C6 fungal-type domain-containing protein n=1 Tax=Pseudomassariella vexata TaxID=1141098 RepID=A0A1Y2EBP6_9PEZI|nr:uncharacterized protein BCR38DRAFT_472400 [Pseudomassariella vexata]ORY68981.1 hypothetical protein BCR38DRAFT_472400 [Pseudomassariella vexata]
MTFVEQRRCTRRRGACQLCRQKKIRCNGQKPCKLCEKHGVACDYSAPIRQLSVPICPPLSSMVSPVHSSSLPCPQRSPEPQSHGVSASLPNLDGIDFSAFQSHGARSTENMVSPRTQPVAIQHDESMDNFLRMSLDEAGNNMEPMSVGDNMINFMDFYDQASLEPFLLPQEGCSDRSLQDVVHAMDEKNNFSMQEFRFSSPSTPPATRYPSISSRLVSRRFQLRSVGRWGATDEALDFTPHGFCVEEQHLVSIRDCMNEPGGYIETAIDEQIKAISSPHSNARLLLLQVLMARGELVSSNEWTTFSKQMVRNCLKLSTSVTVDEDSIPKFLLQFAFDTGLDCVSTLLGYSVGVAHSLSLHTESGILAIASGPDEVVMTKCAVWVLQHIDQIARHMSACRLKSELQYAQVCAQICRNSHPRGRDGDKAGFSTVSKLADDLVAWFSSAPTIVRKSSEIAAATHAPDYHYNMLMFLKYHEAALAICNIADRNLEQVSDNGMKSVDCWQAPAHRLDRATSVREIIAATNSIPSFSNRVTYLHVATLGLCNLVLECQNGTRQGLRERQANQASLAMIFGTFGRLSHTLPKEGFFESVTDLVMMATSSIQYGQQIT